MSLSTSDFILAYLASHHQATATEIAEVLNITRADIRYHLQTLLKAGQVEVSGMSGSTRPGRPSRVFRLPLSDHPKAVHALLAATLALVTTLPAQEQAFVLGKLAGDYFQLQDIANPSFAIRMANWMSRLNDMGYQANWEIRAGSSQVIFRSCPFQTLIGRFPLLCTIDRLGLELVSKGRVETVSLRSELSNLPCVFFVRQ
jgi:predicted ArsR family transcriptional regulator